MYMFCLLSNCAGLLRTANEHNKKNGYCRLDSLIVDGHLATLHPCNPRRINILVALLVVGHNLAQISLRARGNVVRRTGVHQTKRNSKLVSIPFNQDIRHILRLHQLIGLTRSLTLEQMAVLGSLLEHSSVDGIALLKSFLRRSVLADQAGDPGVRAGFVGRLGDAVDDESGREAADGHVEARLFSA